MPRRRTVSLGLSLFALLGASVLPVSAEVPQQASLVQQPAPLTAATVQVSTPRYKADLRSFTPPLGTYTFNVGWQGIPAATLTLTTERQGLYYRIIASARTASGIDLFYRLRYRAEGLLSAEDLLPVKTTFTQKENSKERFTEITYLENGEVHTYRHRKGQDPEVSQFDPRNFMLEPFSAAFIARSLPWEPGMTRSFDTFNGKTRYLIELTCTGEETIEVNGEPRKVWVVSPRVTNLTKREESGKLRRASIYVTADDKRELLRLKSEVFIGSVSAWLVSFEPAANPSGTMVADRRIKEIYIK